MTEAPKRTRPQRAKPKPHPITNPERWMTEHAMALYRCLGPVEEAAQAANRKWGVSRLPRLVSVETAAKFGAVYDQLYRAYDECDCAAVEKWAASATRAWAALDREATEASAQPMHLEAWGVLLEGDASAYIVRSDAAAQAVAEMHPGAPVYTLDEIGRLLSAVSAGLLGGAKSIWPDAEILDIRPTQEPDE